MKPSQAASRRIEQLSKAFGLCSSQASAYAACVTAKQGVKTHECQKEFEAMKQCMKQALPEPLHFGASHPQSLLTVDGGQLQLLRRNKIDEEAVEAIYTRYNPHYTGYNPHYTGYNPHP